MIAFIGPKHLVIPLRLLGIAVFPCENEIEAGKALEEAVSRKENKIIYLTERLAEKLIDRIDKLNQDPNLNIVLIPDQRGSIGLAKKKMDRLIRKAIGASFLLRR